MKTYLSIFLLLICQIVAWAQFPDTLQSMTPSPPPASDTSGLRMLQLDSTTLAVPVDSLGIFQRFFKKDYPAPKKAMYLSLAFPGAGQAYNKSYWKMPLIYGAMGGVIFAIDYNNSRYQRLSTAYQLALKDQPHEFTGTAIDDTSALRNLRDQFDKNRQLSWIGLVAVHLLNAVDAFVDAHLLNFDISDDLSVGVQPNVDVNVATQTTAIGMGVRFSIK